jgi:hypothetical protein
MRQWKAKAAAQYASEMAYQAREARAYEMAMAQSLAMARMAEARREFQLLQLGRSQSYQQDFACRGGYQPIPACPQPVFGVAYPQFSAPLVQQPPHDVGSTHAAPTTGPGAGHMVLRHR